MSGLKLSVAPTQEPITLAEAKAQCRVDIDTDDAYLIDLIGAAREWCEEHDWRAYLTQTWECWLDGWPSGDAIILPKPPLSSVTKVEYYGTDDTKYTLAGTVYAADTVSVPGLVHLKYNQVWPTETALRPYNPICVTFVCGWTNAALVPRRIRQAMLLLIGHWYENRETVVIGTISRSLEFGVTALLGVNRANQF